MSQSVPMEFPVDYLENGDGTMKPVYKDQDSRLRVYFRKVKKPDLVKMLQTGKEEWVEEVLLYKKIKGSTNIPVSRATEADKRIYRREWDQYLKGQKNESGNSLSDLYGIRAHDIAPLHDVGIDTIDQLIEAPDELLQQIDGGLDLKELAKIWAKTRQVEQENTQAIVIASTYRKKSEELEEKIAELEAKLKKTTTKKKVSKSKTKRASAKKKPTIREE